MGKIIEPKSFLIKENDFLGLKRLTDEEYFEGEQWKTYLNSSAGKKDLYTFKRSKIDGEGDQKVTKALNFGKVLHARVLENKVIYKAAPEGMKFNVKAGKEFKAQWEAEGFIVLNYEEGKMVDLMHREVYQNSKIVSLLEGAVCEESAMGYDAETGIKLKAKADARNIKNDYHVIIDLKTTTDASPYGFQKSIPTYGYQSSVHHYETVFEQAVSQPVNDFVWIAIEKEFPFKVGLYYYDNESRKYSLPHFRSRLNKLREAIETNEWPGYSKNIEPLGLPDWYLNQLKKELGLVPRLEVA